MPDVVVVVAVVVECPEPMPAPPESELVAVDEVPGATPPPPDPLVGVVAGAVEPPAPVVEVELWLGELVGLEVVWVTVVETVVVEELPL